MPEKRSVFVTGASGKTGLQLIKELLQHKEQLSVTACVRSQQAKDSLVAAGVDAANLHHLDLSSPQVTSDLATALSGCDALIVCTAAVPEVNVAATLLGGLGRAVGTGVSRLLRRPSSDDPFVPVATWKAGQTPQQVDYDGQVAQFEAARRTGKPVHVVLISSAGGCDPKHFLNYIGAGDILNWKRKAEQHLVASGLPYTILHPNHLVDAPGGQRGLVLGVDDELQLPHWRQRLKMPRADLARLAVAAVLLRDSGVLNRSLDCAAKLPKDGPPTTTLDDFKQLFQSLQVSCNYTINDRTSPDAVWACHGHEAAPSAEQQQPQAAESSRMKQQLAVDK